MPRSRTVVHATVNCSAASRMSAVTSSDHETVVLSRIVASVEPIAMVTTKSNALSLASVRLPDSRSVTRGSHRRRHRPPAHGPMSNQELNHMLHGYPGTSTHTRAGNSRSDLSNRAVVGLT